MSKLSEQEIEEKLDNEEKDEEICTAIELGIYLGCILFFLMLIFALIIKNIDCIQY